MIIVILVACVVGVGALFFFFVRKSEQQDSEDHEKHLGTLEQKLFEERDQQTKKMLEEAKATRQAKPDAAPEISLRIARNGQDLGEMKLGVIKTMLHEGKLAPEDYFLDGATNEWMPLEAHPALIE